MHHTPPHAARNIRLLYLYWFLRDFHLWIPVWIVFLTVERGFSLTDVTGAEGLYLLGVLALEVPTGAVADHWGRSRSLGLGAICLGVSVLIFAFTSSFGVLLASFMLWSVATTLMSGADFALLFDTLKATGREGAYERIAGRGHAFSYAGVGIATLMGGVVASWFDIRTTIFLGVGTCAATAAVSFAMWEPPHDRPAVSERYLRSIGATFRELWSDREVRAVILLSGTTYGALHSVIYLTQPYLVDRGVEIGPLFSTLQVPMFLAGIGGGIFAAGLQRRGRSPLIWLPAAGVAAYAMLAISPGLWAYAAFPMIYLLASCLMPLATGQINRRVASHHRATVLSIHGMVTSLVMAGLAPGIGFATDRWGLGVAFSVGAATTLVSLLLFGTVVLTRRAAPSPTVAAAAPADA